MSKYIQWKDHRGIAGMLCKSIIRYSKDVFGCHYGFSPMSPLRQSEVVLLALETPTKRDCLNVPS